MRKVICSCSPTQYVKSSFDPHDASQVDENADYYRATAYYIADDPEDPEFVETIVFATPSQESALKAAREWMTDEDAAEYGTQVVKVIPDFEWSADPDEVDWFEDEVIWRSWD